MDTLLRHFGSLKELERASFQELRQFLTRREAEAVIAGLSMWSVVDTEEALSGPLDKAEAVYRANLEMRCFRQEVVRVVLLDVQNCWITSVDVCKGTLDESLAHPRDIFRPVIVQAAAGFVLVHNLCEAALLCELNAYVPWRRCELYPAWPEAVWMRLIAAHNETPA